MFKNAKRKGVDRSLWIITATVIFLIVVLVGIIWFTDIAEDLRGVTNITQNRSINFLGCNIICTNCCHGNLYNDCGSTGDPDIDSCHCQDTKPTEYGC